MKTFDKSLYRKNLFNFKDVGKIMLASVLCMIKEIHTFCLEL
jgi:hypothetical protein